ncbi:MAG: NADPH-dependent F420 reductase [Actinomycetota bacterium]|nr:NADPH-dependent F420 reductase [Actinomycetota bacterium]
MDIAVIGGTGDEGFGLALRLARAGHHMTIGSRSEERGAQAAERARGILGGGATVDGTANETAASAAELVFVTVPYAGQADIYRSIAPHIPAGRIVVDTTTPLATAVGGRPWQVIRPWHGSAAEQAKALLPKEARLVAGFHTISAEPLQDVERPMDGDVLLCGADPEAKATVGGLVEQIPNLRWVDAGDLSMARIVEPLTALMVSVNRKYKLKDAGVALTGRDAWGTPAGA